MPARKSVNDYSLSYRKRLPWYKQIREKTLMVGSSGSTVSSKLSYFLIQPFIKEGDGYLNASLREIVSPYYSVYKGSEAKLAADIERLIADNHLFRDADGRVYDPVIREEIEQDSVRFDQISQDHKSIVSNSDNVPSRTGESIVASRVEKRRREEVCASSTHTSYSSTSTPTTTETEGNGNGCAALTARTVPFPGLTEQDLIEVANERPEMDFEFSYGRFVEKNSGKTKVTRKMLSGWFKGEERKRSQAGPAYYGSVIAKSNGEMEEIVIE